MKLFTRNIDPFELIGRVLDNSLIVLAHLIFSIGWMITLFALIGVPPVAVIVFLLNLLPLKKDFLFLDFSEMNVVSFWFCNLVAVPYWIWVFYRFCIKIGLYPVYLSVQKKFKKP